jgi:prepilin-type processing-associated H-X9-DG protein
MGATKSPLPGEQWLMSDAQVDARPKDAEAQLFSAEKSGPGSNHRQYGGNVLFGDGHAAFSPPRARWPILVPPGTVLLNPRP